jgi:hypothetical protein
LGDRTRRDIDEQVAKILRDLDDPEPPLQLTDVRALLELDLRYYSAADTSYLQEKAHQLRIGIRQVIARPTLLVDVVKKLSLKALIVPDRKRILLDKDEPSAKHRWNEAHEIGHNLIPWHKAYLHGDRQRTLKPACHFAIEAEANYAAGRLLFMQERFRDELLSAPVDLARVQALKGTYGNTLTTTLWRTVEHLLTPAIGMISVHPFTRVDNAQWISPCRYFIRSPTFVQRFSKLGELELFGKLAGYCNGHRRGPLGSAEVLLCDDVGQQHVFWFETFNNTHDTLTLGTYRYPRTSAVAASA